MLPNCGAERDAPPACSAGAGVRVGQTRLIPHPSDFDYAGQRNGIGRMLLWDGTHSGTNKVPRDRIELSTPGFSDLCSTN
jgi:hypothetical protein